MTMVTKLYTIRMFEPYAVDVPIRTYKGVDEDRLSDYREHAEENGWAMEMEETGYIDLRFGRSHYVWTKVGASPFPGEGQDNWSTVDPYSNY